VARPHRTRAQRGQRARVKQPVAAARPQNGWSITIRSYPAAASSSGWSPNASSDLASQAISVPVISCQRSAQARIGDMHRG
jgi:hypothetical protein